jgi:hypothetical protein
MMMIDSDAWHFKDVERRANSHCQCQWHWHSAPEGGILLLNLTQVARGYSESPDFGVYPSCHTLPQ